MWFDDVDEEGVEAIRRSERIGQSEVAVSGGDGPLQLFQIGFKVVDPHFRVALLEFVVDERQPSRSDRREDPDGQSPAQRPGQTLRGFSESIGRLEESGHLGEESFSRRRQDDGAIPLPDEQVEADGPLELSHRRRDRRLGDVKVLRRHGHVLPTCNFLEVPQLHEREIECHSPSSSHRCAELRRNPLADRSNFDATRRPTRRASTRPVGRRARAPDFPLPCHRRRLLSAFTRSTSGSSSSPKNRGHYPNSDLFEHHRIYSLQSNLFRIFYCFPLDR